MACNFTPNQASPSSKDKNLEVLPSNKSVNQSASVNQSVNNTNVVPQTNPNVQLAEGALRGEMGWQVGCSVLQCNTYMFEKKLSTDVCLEVGPADEGSTRRRLYAHRYILVSRSPVFEAMLCTERIGEGDGSINDGGLGSVDERAGKIRITDIDPDAFEELLRFMYTEVANITLSNVASLLYASKKYLLPDLSNQCNTFLESNINIETVCEILDQSLFYDEELLTKKCLRFIGPNIRTVLATDGFLSLSSVAVTSVARHDGLYMSSETVLFNACVQWARHQFASNQDPSSEEIRDRLGDVLYCVRLPRMDAEEFARDIGPSRVLSDSDKCSLYYYLLTRNLFEGKPLRFDAGARVQICSRFSCLGSALQWWSCNGPTDAVSFQADHDIEVIGVAVYGGKEKGHHDVNVELRDETGEGNTEPLSKISDVWVDSDGGCSPWPIYFPTPVRISANTLHTIVVTMVGPLTHYGTAGKERTTCDGGVTFQFVSSSKSTNGTNAKSGQIPHIVFKLLK